MSVNSSVTGTQSGTNYGLLTNIKNRPVPNALKPHVNGTVGGGINNSFAHQMDSK